MNGRLFTFCGVLAAILVSEAFGQSGASFTLSPRQTYLAGKGSVSAANAVLWTRSIRYSRRPFIEAVDFEYELFLKPAQTYVMEFSIARTEDVYVIGKKPVHIRIPGDRVRVWFKTPPGPHILNPAANRSATPSSSGTIRLDRGNLNRTHGTIGGTTRLIGGTNNRRRLAATAPAATIAPQKSRISIWLQGKGTKRVRVYSCKVTEWTSRRNPDETYTKLDVR